MFKNCRSLIRPLARFFSNNYSQHVLEHLSNRSLIRVSGQEATDFLQGLITNDIKHLENGPGSMYTMFLNSKGRVLYDTVIYRIDDANTLLVECDISGVEALQKQLKMFRVKRKINIDNLKDDYKVYALFNTSNINLTNKRSDFAKEDGYIVPCDRLNATLPPTTTKIYKDLMIFKDPRIISLGSRIICKSDVNIEEQIQDLIEIIKSEINYRLFRYSLGVGEGVNDIPSGNSFPLESNCDYLHGVSFHKGCYIGQELTARTHHTGVVRKRLMPLYFVKPPSKIPNDQTILHENDNLGKLRGIEGNVALALLRISKALDYGEINIGDGIAKVVKPNWWPVEASKEKISLQKS